MILYKFGLRAQIASIIAQRKKEEKKQEENGFIYRRN